jgi:hypothetical protein
MSDNLILDIKPNQLVSYNKLLIGFYDKLKEKKVNGKLVQEPVLYIHIQNSNDRHSILKRKSGIKKIPVGAYGDLQPVEETKLYARAYKKYLEAKAAYNPDLEKKTLEAEIEALKSKIDSKEEKKIEEKEERKETIELTARDIKAKLDELGVQYKGNASKEVLLELLANNE